MKIEYLSLENFVNVYAGLGRKKVVLDFTKSKNNKVLLLGDNGSGKTVLLSSLQPYRETLNIIISFVQYFFHTY